MRENFLLYYKKIYSNIKSNTIDGFAKHDMNS